MQHSGCSSSNTTNSSNNFFENNPTSASTSQNNSDEIGGNGDIVAIDPEKKSLSSLVAGSSNGERLPNFSKLDVNAHHSEHRSSTITSSYFNKMNSSMGGVTTSINNSNKPGDVKKIVIKNFKGMFHENSIVFSTIFHLFHNDF